MRAVIQRASEASVTVDQKITGAIGQGLVVLLGVGKNDTEKDVTYLAEKIANLRIFADDHDLMNKSLLDVGGAMLIISQFTLHGDCRKGRRPSWNSAAPPELAENLYNLFIHKVANLGITTASGVFQAMMKVSLVNDGPVTIMLDSEKTF